MTNLYNPTVAQIIRIVDGDTVVCDTFHVILAESFMIYGTPGGGLPQRRYRLARINAPELATSAGQVARDALAQLMLDHSTSHSPVPCWLGSIKPTHYEKDNHDRIVCEIELMDGINLSDWMLTNGYANAYPAK